MSVMQLQLMVKEVLLTLDQILDIRYIIIPTQDDKIAIADYDELARTSNSIEEIYFTMNRL